VAIVMECLSVFKRKLLEVSQKAPTDRAYQGLRQKELEADFLLHFLENRNRELMKGRQKPGSPCDGAGIKSLSSGGRRTKSASITKKILISTAPLGCCE
jgi:hypothetical protein